MKVKTRISTDAPSIAEIIEAINTLPGKKAPGIDGIPAEFYKANPNQAACFLQPLIREAWQYESFSSEWTDGISIKIPKKGNLLECDNCRGICVLPAVSKLILERVMDPLISIIDAEQSGFRAGLSCTEYINSVRIIIEQCKELRSDLHIVFFAFKKAFESVNRDCI